MYSTVHALASIIEHLKSIVDGENFFCGLVLEFQMAFNNVKINSLLR